MSSIVPAESISTLIVSISLLITLEIPKAAPVQITIITNSIVKSESTNICFICNLLLFDDSISGTTVTGISSLLIASASISLIFVNFDSGKTFSIEASSLLSTSSLFLEEIIANGAISPSLLISNQDGGLSALL